MEYMPHYTPRHMIVDCANILLVGHVGAGKSSFINSLHSALNERVEDVVFCQDANNISTTIKVRIKYQ